MDTDATTGQRWYLCESANTWVVQGGGGGSPGGSSTEVQYRGGASTFSALTGSSVPNSGELRIGSGVTPSASASRSIFNIGAAIAAGSSSGNMLGINAPSGFGGNILEAEVNGTRVMTINSAGGVTVSTGDTMAINGTNITGTRDGTIFMMNTSTGSSASTRISGVNTATGAGNFLALRATFGGGTPTDQFRINANGKCIMEGQTVNTSTLTNCTVYKSDRTAAIGTTRDVIEAGPGQSTDLWAVYAYNATPMSGTKYLSVDSAGFLSTQFSTPASSTETCVQGRIKFDADYIYLCTATDTYKRATLAAF